MKPRNVVLKIPAQCYVKQVYDDSWMWFMSLNFGSAMQNLVSLPSKKTFTTEADALEDLELMLHLEYGVRE